MGWGGRLDNEFRRANGGLHEVGCRCGCRGNEEPISSRTGRKRASSRFDGLDMLERPNDRGFTGAVQVLAHLARLAKKGIPR